MQTGTHLSTSSYRQLAFCTSMRPDQSSNCPLQLLPHASCYIASSEIINTTDAQLPIIARSAAQA